MPTLVNIYTEAANSMSENKTLFVMSQFVNETQLYKAKAVHYEEKTEKLQMENVVLMERLAHVEKLLARHEEG